MLDATGGCATGAVPWSDDHGHGTHCSGTAAGAVVGASKSTIVHAVKVLSAAGSGSTSSIAAGCNWCAWIYLQARAGVVWALLTPACACLLARRVLNALAANPSLRPAVVSMSLGGGSSAIVDSAVASLVAAGVTTVVAAGNANADACAYSPSREASAITVAASTVGSAKASFSNYGACVDLFAPGENVKSCSNAAGAYATWSGTSMATPHVAGVVALMLAAKPCLTPATVAAILVATAATDALSGVPVGTANKLINAKAAVQAAALSTTC